VLKATTTAVVQLLLLLFIHACPRRSVLHSQLCVAACRPVHAPCARYWQQAYRVSAAVAGCVAAVMGRFCVLCVEVSPRPRCKDCICKTQKQVQTGSQMPTSTSYMLSTPAPRLLCNC
jgi:hypothetical protein